LGKRSEANYYAEVAAKVREAYMNEYVAPNGLISSDTQTAYVLALQFNMLPEALRAQAVDRLVANIERYSNHITTGFLGTSYICNVLTEYGRSDMAYKLLLQETCPSWIYSVKKGATTIWERWNSIQPDGSIIDGMNSFNHYSYGAIGDWLYRSAVGIREAAPGFKKIIVRPHTGGGFDHMQASTQTPYGKLAAKWTAEADVLKTLEVEIPVNTIAEIYVPASSLEVVKSANALKPVGYEDGYAKFEVGSGKYSFAVQ
jgi:alpha-L-rhamnosidase